MKRKDDPSQLMFAVFEPAKFLRQADGSLIVQPGKPLEELTPMPLARHFGVDRETVYRWHQEGLIAEEFKRPAGKRRWKFAAKLIPVLEEKFRAMHS